MQILTYSLIVLLLVLVGVAGLQFSYMFYVDRLNRERKAYLRDLERRARRLNEKLEQAEAKIAEQSALLAKFVPEYVTEDETGADILDER